MNIKSKPYQDDEAIEIAGQEDESREDGDDEGQSIEIGVSDDSDVEAEAEDEADDSDIDTSEVALRKAASLKELETDDDVQFQVEHLEEQRKAIDLYRHQVREAGPALLKEWGLEHFPITDNGRAISIYKLSDDEFDVLIDRMEENENIARATIRGIQKSRARYDAKVEVFEKQMESDLNNYHGAEWALIAKKAPKVVKDNEDAIANWIKGKAGDPVIARRAETFKGKLSLVNMAVRELNLQEKAQTMVSKNRPQPAVHNMQTAGKTKKSNSGTQEITMDFIRKVSKDPVEFAKHEKAIDAAIKANKVKM